MLSYVSSSKCVNILRAKYVCGNNDIINMYLFKVRLYLKSWHLRYRVLPADHFNAMQTVVEDHKYPTNGQMASPATNFYKRQALKRPEMVSGVYYGQYDWSNMGISVSFG